MTSELKIITLGEFDITYDNSSIFTDVSRRKAESLLIYCVCERVKHTRESLANMFWESSGQSQALTNLRVVLQYLKPFLHIERQFIAFNTDVPVWLDRDILVDTLNKADKIWQKTQKLPSDLLGELEANIGLYKGPFLKGFHIRDSSSFDSWLQQQQINVETKLLNALLQLANTYLSVQQINTAIQTLRRLIEIDPLHQQANYELARILASTQQRNAAQQHILEYETLIKNELGLDLSDEFSELIAQLMGGQEISLTESTTVPHNLPVALTSFVQRPEMSKLLDRILNTGCRLLTVIGSGGMGKTRLAIECGQQILSHYPDGVYIINLQVIDNSDLIMLMIADTLQIPLSGLEPPLTQIASYLQDKHLLLILDNFEHLSAGALQVHDLLTSTRSLNIIVTSREPLNLVGEWLLPLEGMPLPESTDTNAISYSSIQLFIQAALRIQPNFEIEKNLHHIVEICTLLDGTPLAIELAATWLWHTDIVTTLEQIKNDVMKLNTIARNIPQRHQTIETVFEYSWQLFDENLRTILSQLAIFKGTFSLEAAYAIVGVDQQTLDKLVRRALLQGKKRYQMHGLLREFLIRKIPEQTVLFDKYHHYFQDLLTTIQDEASTEFDQLEYIAKETKNLRSLLEWDLVHQKYNNLLKLANKLSFYWERRANYSEARYWFESIFDFPEELDPVEYAKGLYSAGIFAWGQSDYDALLQYAKSNLKVSYELEDNVLILRALHQIGNAERFLGNYKSSIDYFEKALGIAQKIKDKRREVLSLASLGSAYIELEDFGSALKYNKACLSYMRESGNEHHLATVLANIALCFTYTGKYEKANNFVREALELYLKLESPYGQALCENILGTLSEGNNKLQEALAHHIESLLLYSKIENTAGVCKQFIFIAYTYLQLDKIEQALSLVCCGTYHHKVTTNILEVKVNLIHSVAKNKLSADVYDSSCKKGIKMSLEEALNDFIDLF